MAWSTPLTAVSNTALTAAQWNASVRDNLLETGPAKVTVGGQILVSTSTSQLAARTISTNFVSNLETTTSTTYTDLTTPGPAVTVTTGAQALVALKCDASNSGASGSVMSVAVSGTTSQAATDANSIGPDNTNKVRLGALVLLAIVGGSNTFTAKYRVTGGTGTFVNRSLIVIPL
jgi:hypothetical protein